MAWTTRQGLTRWPIDDKLRSCDADEREPTASENDYTRWATQKLVTFALTIPESDVTRHLGKPHGSILETFRRIDYVIQ